MVERIELVSAGVIAHQPMNGGFSSNFQGIFFFILRCISLVMQTVQTVISRALKPITFKDFLTNSLIKKNPLNLVFKFARSKWFNSYKHKYHSFRIETDKRLFTIMASTSDIYVFSILD